MEEEGDYSTLATRDYELPRDTVHLVEIIGERRGRDGQGVRTVEGGGMLVAIFCCT